MNLQGFNIVVYDTLTGQVVDSLNYHAQANLYPTICIP